MKKYYQVVYCINDYNDDCEYFDTLKEAKAFAKNYKDCVITRWLDEYEEDLYFKPIFINCEE